MVESRKYNKYKRFYEIIKYISRFCPPPPWGKGGGGGAPFSIKSSIVGKEGGGWPSP